MESPEEKNFWQELLNKVLQCERIALCLARNPIVFCQLPQKEDCEILLFERKLRDWSEDFYKFYLERWEEIRKITPSYPQPFLRGQELCFFYLTILGMCALFLSPKINWRLRPLFTRESLEKAQNKLNPKDENSVKELLTEFKNFTEDASWDDFVEEIDVAFENLRPTDSTRQQILLVLWTMIEALKSSLTPIEELSTEDLAKLHQELVLFLKRQAKQNGH